MDTPRLLCLERTCSYCGARLEVSAAELPAERRPHAFTCLQCGKPDEVICTGHPHVRVLAPRADGRSTQYQETMF
jgi:transcription elongation factor Elf1